MQFAVHNQILYNIPIWRRQKPLRRGGYIMDANTTTTTTNKNNNGHDDDGNNRGDNNSDDDDATDEEVKFLFVLPPTTPVQLCRWHSRHAKEKRINNYSDPPEPPSDNED